MLRGASAEARDALDDRLDQASGDLAAVGEELFGAAALLRDQVPVRRILTDASIEPDAKAGLAENLFGDAVGAQTLELLQEAVRRRWSRPADLADVVERLGVVALVRSAGSEGERISDELFAVRQLVDEQDDLRSSLSDPSRSPADKRQLLEGLLEGKVQQATALLVGQAVTGAHGAVDQALEELQHLAAEAQHEKLASVHTARELEDRERDRLAEALGRQYGTTVHVQVVVDPDLLGGLRVQIGDDVIDGSVATRLDEARRRLVG